MEAPTGEPDPQVIIEDDRGPRSSYRIHARRKAFLESLTRRGTPEKVSAGTCWPKDAAGGVPARQDHHRRVCAGDGISEARTPRDPAQMAEEGWRPTVRRRTPSRQRTNLTSACR